MTSSEIINKYDARVIVDASSLPEGSGDQKTAIVNGYDALVTTGGGSSSGGLPVKTENETYYIDGTSGDDTNDGSSGSPFKTFAPIFGTDGVGLADWQGYTLTINTTNYSGVFDIKGIHVVNGNIVVIGDSANDTYSGISVDGDTLPGCFLQMDTIQTATGLVERVIDISNIECKINIIGNTTDTSESGSTTLTNCKFLDSSIGEFGHDIDVVNCSGTIDIKFRNKGGFGSYDAYLDISGEGNLVSEITINRLGSSPSGNMITVTNTNIHVPACVNSGGGAIASLFYSDNAIIVRNPNSTPTASTVETKVNGGQIFS